MAEGTSYMSEPDCNAKVMMATSMGDIEIELWGKQCPLATKNFLQLCLDGYYDGCIFHRIIKDFMAQTGDPTGTGVGGASIYGDPPHYGETFKDEFHQRLRFNRRGMIGMANTDEKNSNGSQFFITLGDCSFLQKKNTCFGKVTGQTVFNVVKFNDTETDDNDRPKYDPPRIRSTRVLLNPYPEMLPRQKEVEKPKKKKKRKKKLCLLSFGEEQRDEDVKQEETEVNLPTKAKSSHDALDDDPTLLKDSSLINNTPIEPVEEEGGLADSAIKQSVRDRLKKIKKDDKKKKKKKKKDGKGGEEDSGSDVDEVADAIKARKKKYADEIRKLANEVQEIGKPKEEKKKKALMRDNISTTSSKSKAFRTVTDADFEGDTLLTELQKRRKKYVARSKNTREREKDTLAKLASFQKRVKRAPQVPGPKPFHAESGPFATDPTPEIDEDNEDNEDDDEEDDEDAPSTTKTKGDLFGKGSDEDKEEKPESRWLSDSEDDDPEDDSWMRHKVKFHRRPQDFDPMARDVNAYEYTVSDPRGEHSFNDKKGSLFKEAKKRIQGDRNRSEKHKQAKDDVRQEMGDLLAIEDLDRLAEGIPLSEEEDEDEDTDGDKEGKDGSSDKNDERSRGRGRGRDSGRDRGRDRPRSRSRDRKRRDTGSRRDRSRSRDRGHDRDRNRRR